MGLYNPSNISVSTKKTTASIYVYSDDAVAEDILISPSNIQRHQTIIFNKGQSTLYIGLAPQVDSSRYTIKLLPARFFFTPENYTGEIRTTSDSAYNVMLTEMTYF